MHRCWTPEDLHRDGRIILEGGEAHRIRKVFRLRPGDKVCLFNDEMKEAEAQVTRFFKGKVELKVREVRNVHREPPIRITLIQGIPKGDRMEFIVQKCTELGIWEIMALQTRRSVPRLENERAMKKVERWRRIAMEASRQSGRSHIPHISGPWSLEGLEEELKGADCLKIILWEEASQRGLKDILSECKACARPQVMIAVGPEGGFEEVEVEAFCSMGFTAAKLGPRILRTETAAPVATAIIQYTLGDLGEA
jgi:16S rRNA (uracil1498-N3)-methyltransferase